MDPDIDDDYVARQVHAMPPEILATLGWHEYREDELVDVIKKIPRGLDYVTWGAGIGEDFYAVTPL
jgi:hypothetical protein